MKKLLAILLSLVLVAGVLVSCGGNEDDGGTTTEGKEVETTEGLYEADLPDTKFDGADFRILTVDESSCMYTTFDCGADVSNKVLAAQYKRNREIENKYELVFKQELVDTWEPTSTTFEEYTSVGDDAYELNMLIQREAFKYALQGLVTRTSDLPYCDPSKPWYVHGINDALALGGVSFFAYTAECINLFSQTDCILFNASMLEDLQGMENPYDLVESDNWTVDKLLSSAKDAADDLDGDTYVDDRDRLGIVAEGDVLYPSLWIGAGFKMVEKDEDDMPEYTAYKNEKLIDLLVDIMETADEEGALYDTAVNTPVEHSQAGEQRGYARDVFVSGHALYRVAMIGKIAELADMQDDFGIVPCPKIDETQKEYQSRSADGWIYVVPFTNSHLEMTSIVLEELGVASKNYVYDAFYREQLQDRYSRGDQRAIKMLDLISDSMTLDLGDTIWQGMVRNKTLDIFWLGENTFASSLNSMKMMADLTISLDVEDLQALLDK